MDDSRSLDGANEDVQRAPFPIAYLGIHYEPPRIRNLLLGPEGRALHYRAPTQQWICAEARVDATYNCVIRFPIHIGTRLP